MKPGRDRRLVVDRLLGRLEEKGVDAETVAEWLWEEFGVRVKPEWRRIRRAAAKAGVTLQDLVSLYNELDVEVEEDDWW